MALKVEPGTWYTVDEVAGMRGVSKKTLEAERIKGGGIPFSRIGRRIFYKGEDIEAYVERHRRRSTSDLGRPENVH